MSKKAINISGIILSFFIGVIAMYLVILKYPLTTTTEDGTFINKNVTITDTGIADAVEKLYDATVVIGAYKEGTLASSGTGFIYKTEGNCAYIITNHHVVDSATSVKVKFTNDKIENVELVASDKYADIAVLKIDKDKIISVAEIGNSENSRLGDTVFTIGGPLSDEYSWTVTRGIVSGKDRLVEVSVSNTSSADWVMSVIQTDASINSGNSGGPLANANGEVIGVTNMKLVSSGVEGMGFAIPIEDAVNYADQLIKEGKIARPLLGVSMGSVADAYSLYHYGITLDNSITEGVVVVEVQEKSAADKAGLKKGDVITKIEDYDVSSVAKLKYYLYKYSAGDKVKLTYIRNGKTETTTATLTESEN